MEQWVDGDKDSEGTRTINLKNELNHLIEIGLLRYWTTPPAVNYLNPPAENNLRISIGGIFVDPEKFIKTELGQKGDFKCKKSGNIGGEWLSKSAEDVFGAFDPGYFIDVALSPDNDKDTFLVNILNVGVQDDQPVTYAGIISHGMGIVVNAGHPFPVKLYCKFKFN